MKKRATFLLISLLLLLPVAITNTLADETSKTDYSYAIDLFGTSDLRATARQYVLQKNRQELIPALIRSLRYFPQDARQTTHVLQQLTGADHGKHWFEWQLWLESHPSPPMSEQAEYISTILKRIDSQFGQFIYSNVPHRILLDEIVWGGVKKDGIPALIHPAFIAAKDANYLSDNEQVFGVSIHGNTRAYPLRIMDWHEMANDIVGGIPVALAYCTLCGAGILYQTEMPGEDEPTIFSSSGLLFRSNKLMYDQKTNSLWDHYSGKPVVGLLVNENITLPTLPIVTTSWKQWRTTHPQTKVLHPNTGFARDYTPGAAYGAYFNSQDLLFPASLPDSRHAKKERVFVLRNDAINRAWSLQEFRQSPVIHKNIGIQSVVLIANVQSETVRAYRANQHHFTLAKNGTLQSDGQQWTQTEEELIGPEGERLHRLPGHMSYWFAWSNRFSESEAAFE